MESSINGAERKERVTCQPRISFSKAVLQKEGRDKDSSSQRKVRVFIATGFVLQNCCEEFFIWEEM